MLLLEAVEMYGLGNWAAVAEHVGTKGEGACRGHYYAVYVDVPSFPEPTPLPGMLHVNQAQVGTGPSCIRGMHSMVQPGVHAHAVVYGGMQTITHACLLLRQGINVVRPGDTHAGTLLLAHLVGPMQKRALDSNAILQVSIDIFREY